MKNTLLTLVLIFIGINSFSQNRYAGTPPNAPPKNKDAKDSYNNGYGAFTEENYQDAIKYYKQAIVYDSSFTDAIDNLALTYRRINNLDSAEYYYLKSLAFIPNNMMALNNLALVYKMSGQLDKSAEAYNKIIEIDSLNADGFYGLAEINGRQNDFDSSIKNALIAYKLWEKTNELYAGDAMKIVGIAQFSKGDKINAKKSFLKSRQLGTMIPDGYINACNE